MLLRKKFIEQTEFNKLSVGNWWEMNLLLRKLRGMGYVVNKPRGENIVTDGENPHVLELTW